ncbi:hypothetical protein ACFFRR_006360 [Megaselia abdita]
MNNILGLSALFLLLAVGVESKTLKYPPLFEGKSLLENPNLRLETKADSINYRLPNETIPIHYDVHLTTRVHSKEEDFSGVVKISINVLADTKSVVLHARELTIDSAQITDNAKVIPCDAVYPTENPTEFLTITPKDGQILTKGKQLVVEITYHGKLRKDNGGFYLSTYKSENGEERWLATTQFESTDARHAFPCYDEPAKRATFSFAFTHGKNYNAICDTDPIGEPEVITGTDMVKTTFKQTTPMSTYITAFIISDFEFTEIFFRGLRQRVYSRPNTKDHQEFALVSASQIIASLDDYFGVEFKDMLPQAKLDQVAVPDFAAGAMENWGLTTYREEYLLYENGKSTAQTQTNIANILGHEDVHQWFGDYVCVEWWTYLWLKESFAQYYSYVSNDNVYPEWDIYQLYIVSEYQGGMAADSGRSPRPMTHYVQTPREISSLYDSISYAKGSAILRMWNHAITEKVFQGGLQKHLKERAFQSAVEEQLFENIQKSAQAQNFPLPYTIDEMMGSWTRQGGHPLLTVERNYEDGSFTVKQQQYFTDSTIEDNNKLFHIPFNYVSGNDSDYSDTKATNYLHDKSVKIDAKLGKEEFLILNKQSTGFYNIKYDTENWKLISKALRRRHFNIHSLNRASLIYDANKLSSSSRLDYDILLDLLSYLESEDDYAPWATANGIFTNFNFYLQGDNTAHTDLKFFIRQITNRVYEKLGASDKTNERHFDHYLRSIIMNLACMGGDENCLKQTTEKLSDFVENNTPIEANLQSSVYCNGLKDADSATFKKVHDYMYASDDLAQRRSLISSLGCAQRKENVETYINSSLDPQAPYRNNEQNGILLATYSRGQVGLEASIEFLNNRYAEYYKLTPGFGKQNVLEADLSSMPAYIVSEDTKKKYDDLLKKIRSDATITLNEKLEENANSRVKSNLDWNAKNSPQVAKWLFNNARGGAGQMVASVFTVLSALFVSRYLM